MRRFVSIALLMASLSTTADAQPIVYGLGISSCGYWTDNRQKSRHASELSQISWVQGFLSAFNVYSGGADISEGIDANGILAWMDDYCMEHPFEPIAVASGALIKELQRRGAQK